MNVQDYIASGMIENYVLGLASAEERAEFERMSAAHSEVRAARESFELILEKQLQDQAITPPANLKSKVFAEIEVEKDSQQEKIIPIRRILRVKANWARSVAAAAIILLAGSTILNFYFFTQYKKYINKYDELVASQNQMAITNKTLETKLSDYASAIGHMKDTGMALVKMVDVPTSPSPGCSTTVYWDTRSKDVYLLVNNLPKPASDKQYQLWAMVDGKPVDAGIFDMNEGLPFMKMKNIPEAQAFAITLEKKGGSSVPTMESMYVMGKVAG